MGRLLFVVEHAFLIKCRGLVLSPGILPKGDERFRNGDPVELHRPDGSKIATRIGSMEFYTPNTRGDFLIMLKDLAKADVPVGTEVWSVTNDESL